MWKYNCNYHWVLTFGCLSSVSVSSRDGSQRCIQNKQGDSVNLDIVKIQVLTFKNNKKADLFPFFQRVQMASFHNHFQKGKKQSRGIDKGDFPESVLDLRIYRRMKTTATKSPLSFARAPAYEYVWELGLKVRTTPLNKFES